jgi:phosphonate transport system substrate-binding protein
MRWTWAIPRRLKVSVLSTIVAAIGAAGHAGAVEPLRIGMVPDAGATQVSVEEKAPLQKYLEHELGRPVVLIIPTNYNATVEGIGNGSLDIAYFGGLTYVKAHARYGAVPLVQRDVDRQFHSLFITREGSGITSLTQLAGKSFCFGDINSTSGHLYPVLAMTQAGISPDKSLKSVRYTGSHPATAQAVALGACDAGAMDQTVFQSLIADGKLNGAKLRVFYTTPAFADYVWAARKGLSPADVQAFDNALLRLQPGHDDRILDILRGKHFVRADNAEYGDVARVAKDLGLM